jgi:aminopeptidase N
MVKWFVVALAIVALSMDQPSNAKSIPIPPRSDILLQQERLIDLESRNHHLLHDNPPRVQDPKTTVQQAGFDVLHYDIDWEIDPGRQLISGTVAAKCSVVDPHITHFAFNLQDNMTVHEVMADGRPIFFDHEDNLVTILSWEMFVLGDTAEIAINYSGTPDSIGRFNPFSFKTHGTHGAPTIFSISAPYYAGTWWPCKDIPDDKATATIHITIPETLVAASNGRLLDVVPLGDGKHRYEWEESYPISTYLISVAVSDYLVFSDYYTYGANDSMEVMYFVYPEDSLDAREDFNVTVSLIELYSSIFGPYPFLEEKYGMAEAKWGGLAMEHQTCTTYGSAFVTGTHQNDRVIAHELAHQWWGDLVTVGDWRDIWLNEGFATYAEALWLERTEGIHEYRDFMARRSLPIGFAGSIYDPNDLYNLTVYWKGAWVLHMLRHVMGDASFFQALSDYRDAHAYENAVTVDFQNACETIYGGPLDWFFQQWIYGTGRPHYAYSWVQYMLGGVHYVSLDVEQIQTEANSFRMPVDVRLYGAGWDTTLVVDIVSRKQRFTLEASALVDSLVVDPDGWVLKRLERPGVTSDLGRIPSLWLTYPNPFSPSTGMSMALHIPWAGRIELEVFDVSGARIKTIFEGWLTAEPREFLWDGTDDRGSRVSSGVYFIRLLSPQGTFTRKALMVK